MEKKVWIFQEFYISGFGDKRLVRTAPVADYETGQYLIDKTIELKKKQTGNNLKVTKMTDGLVELSWKYMSQNHMEYLQVSEEVLYTKADIDAVMDDVLNCVKEETKFEWTTN